MIQAQNVVSISETPATRGPSTHGGPSTFFAEFLIHISTLKSFHSEETPTKKSPGSLKKEGEHIFPLHYVVRGKPRHSFFQHGKWKNGPEKWRLDTSQKSCCHQQNYLEKNPPKTRKTFFVSWKKTKHRQRNNHLKKKNEPALGEPSHS